MQGCLINNLSSLDEFLFEDIFYKNYDRIYSGFLKKTRNDVVAEELTQITFMKFWEYRHSFTLDLPTELQLNRKAKLVFIDWLRKEAYRRKITSELERAPLSEYTTASKLELTDTLKKAMNKLPPVRKRVFQLAYIEGFSHKEIADFLDISPKTVDAHIFKALQLLRNAIALSSVLALIEKNFL